MTTTTITARDGRKATAPAAFAAKWAADRKGQDIIDSFVVQAHRGNAMDVATCRAVGITAVSCTCPVVKGRPRAVAANATCPDHGDLA